MCFSMASGVDIAVITEAISYQHSSQLDAVRFLMVSMACITTAIEGGSTVTSETLYASRRRAYVISKL